MIAELQSERMDEQRAQLPGFVNRSGRNLVTNPTTNETGGLTPNINNTNSNPAPDDAFLDMLMRCQVS